MMPGLQSKTRPTYVGRVLFLGPARILFISLTLAGSFAAQQTRHYLYVAVPGTDAATTDRGPIGILVFDIDNGHRFVRRISPWPAAKPGEQVRGIVAHDGTRRLYVSTVERVAAIDLVTGRVRWEKSYDGRGCDRLDVSPDGKTIHAPAFGKPEWYVINTGDGELIAKIGAAGFPRQTIYARDGKHAYLAAWESRVLSVVDTATHKVVREVGPFSNFVCPFAINRRETYAFANVDGLVGFEVGDLRSGLVLDRVVVEDSNPDAWSTFECPSHGLALTPDERELWVADGVDNRVRIFDATTYPPSPVQSIDLRAPPRWIVFSRDGRYAYPSTGDVVDVSSKKIVGALEDDQGAPVRSERIVEVF
jgi:DNA-binding beta-propeller fold protein YncE